MIYVDVKVSYRDDSMKRIKCTDMPTVGSEYLVLCPYNDPVRRIFIVREKIADIEWTFKCDNPGHGRGGGGFKEINPKLGYGTKKEKDYYGHKEQGHGRNKGSL